MLAFKSIEEQLDTASAAEELVFQVFGAVAHFESRLIAERSCDGVAAAHVLRSLQGRFNLGEQKLLATFALVDAGLIAIHAARQLGLGFLPFNIICDKYDFAVGFVVWR
ncbi:recombinase family protein [Skermanella rosea]|uniref:recombinase family protein n=1 Tax=Skermanella rosea TaxID=1817965 RepID=UPI001E65B58F|nr:recombinase family protein [Skermanella rosea]UEM03357.1 recombinase family protein [Skermanella rosea]